MNNSFSFPAIVAVALILFGSPAEGSWLSDRTGVHINLNKAIQQAASDSAQKVKTAEATGSKEKALTVVKQELANASEAAQDAAKIATDQQQRADALAVQKNTFLLAAVSLVLTNAFTLGGLLGGRRRTKLEIRKLTLEIEERELALKQRKRKSATDDANTTV